MSTETKKDTWRWLINLLASVLTALAAALGTTSCVSNLQTPSSLPPDGEGSASLESVSPIADSIAAKQVINL